MLERRALVGNNFIVNWNVGAVTVNASNVFPYAVVATCVNAVRGDTVVVSLFLLRVAFQFKKICRFSGRRGGGHYPSAYIHITQYH